MAMDSRRRISRVPAARLVRRAMPDETPTLVLSDGAKSIRCDLVAIFGVLVTIILDWYHLEKKVWDLLSMACRNKEEKEWHARKVLSYLWRGGVSEALRYLREEVAVKNAKKLEELTEYKAPRVLLHAHKLAFTHPRTGKIVNFKAPIPADMEEAVKFLRLE